MQRPSLASLASLSVTCVREHARETHQVRERLQQRRKRHRHHGQPRRAREKEHQAVQRVEEGVRSQQLTGQRGHGCLQASGRAHRSGNLRAQRVDHPVAVGRCRREKAAAIRGSAGEGERAAQEAKRQRLEKERRHDDAAAAEEEQAAEGVRRARRRRRLVRHGARRTALASENLLLSAFSARRTRNTAHRVRPHRRHKDCTQRGARDECRR